jgi:phosphoenolpyruvate carboxylase
MENADLPLKKDEIYERLKFYARDIERDPQTNSVFRLAQDYFFALSKGDLSANALSAPVQDITDELFSERAAFIAMQHELHLPESPWEMISEKLSQKAAEGLDAFKNCVETPVGGIVFTAHPTFANPLSERQRLAELAVSDAAESTAVSAPTDYTQGITLQQEHEEAQNAIANAQASVSSYLKAVLETAHKAYPNEWRSLRPVAPTLASWVGYDLDGRSDIHWWTSLAYRLKEKSEQIGRYANALKDIGQSARDAAAIETLIAELETAKALAAKQSDLFFGDLSKAELMVEAANTLTENDDANLVSIRALSERVAALMDGEDDDTALRLLQLSRQMEILGFGTARIHLRINAAQIQSVIRRDLGFLTEDNDLGQVALDTLADKLRATVPAKINFGDLFLEQSTARRQFMLCAQISKHIDADTPIRFLIAESENPATVLGALYLARQYGVEAQLDISPLFETPEALENGGRFVARLLKVPEFQEYVRTRGQLSIQLGFSDAGRFIGQVAADIAIERIQSHIASALAEQMPGIALLFFNTHGESAGRGAYPGDFKARLNHVLPAHTPSLCARLGVPLRNEVSFQGGDGYIHFANQPLSDSAYLAFVREGVFTQEHDDSDPFYQRSSLVWDFYRALRLWHETLFDDPDYAVLLGEFAGGFLLDAGSRPKRRAKGPAGPRSLRAISHNATLQQLGALANTACGIGSALERDIDELVELIDDSPRLRALVDLALFGRVRTSIPALRSYAAVYSPSFWVACTKRSGDADRKAARTMMYRLVRSQRISSAMNRCADHLSIDLGRFDQLISRLKSAPSVSYRHEARLPIHALHAMRQGAMMRALEIAGSLPTISERHGFDIDDVQHLIVEMRIEEAVGLLRKLFPKSALDIVELSDLKEPREERGDLTTSDYTALHKEFLDPLMDIQKLIHQISRAISHAHLAYG